MTDAALNANRRAERRGTVAPALDGLAERIERCVVGSTTVEALQARCQRDGIEMAVTRRSDGQIQGTKFRAAGASEWLKASSIARGLAWSKLSARLAEQAALLEQARARIAQLKAKQSLAGEAMAEPQEVSPRGQRPLNQMEKSMSLDDQPARQVAHRTEAGADPLAFMDPSQPAVSAAPVPVPVRSHEQAKAEAELQARLGEMPPQMLKRLAELDLPPPQQRAELRDEEAAANWAFVLRALLALVLRILTLGMLGRMPGAPGAPAPTAPSGDVLRAHLAQAARDELARRPPPVASAQQQLTAARVRLKQIELDGTRVGMSFNLSSRDRDRLRSGLEEEKRRLQARVKELEVLARDEARQAERLRLGRLAEDYQREAGEGWHPNPGRPREGRP